jgi:hypothetical protein
MGNAQRLTGRGAAYASVLALIAAVLLGCASSGERREQQAAAQATGAEEEDAKCREAGEPGTPAYEQCRERLEEKRAEAERIEARRHEDFQRILGEGTSAHSGH